LLHCIQCLNAGNLKNAIHVMIVHPVRVVLKIITAFIE